MHINAHLDIDVVAVESDDVVTVMLDLEAPQDAAAATRPDHAAVVVLDRSGSMNGPRLHAAKQALLLLVDRLSDTDSLSVVAFDNQAELVVPGAPIGQSNRDRIKREIGALDSGGSTDLSSGYLRGLQEARRIAGDTGATIVVLSDGHANTGMMDPDQFRKMAAQAAKQGITTSTIGVGLGYDDQILSELAIGGTGNHTFAEEADAAGAAIAGEIDGLLSKTVQAASLRIVLGDACQAVRILNDLPMNLHPDFAVVELGDFYSGESRRLLLELLVPAMPGLGLAQVADLVLEYVSIPDLQSHQVTAPISVNVVPADLAKGRVPDAQVRHSSLLLKAQEAKKSSERALRSGDVGAAKDVLRTAMTSLTDLGDASDPLIADEVTFILDSMDMIDRRGMEYGSRNLSSDRVKKSRGYTTRGQGGKRDMSAGPVCHVCGSTLGPDETSGQICMSCSA